MTSYVVESLKAEFVEIESRMMVTRTGGRGWGRGGKWKDVDQKEQASSYKMNKV